MNEKALADVTLKYLKETIDSWDSAILPKESGPYIARLQDDSQPNGIVEIVDRKGAAHLMMNRADYDEIMRYDYANQRSN